MRTTNRESKSGSKSDKVFTSTERNRLIAMSVLLVLMLGAFLYSLLQEKEYAETAELNSDIPVVETFTDTVVVPDFDLARIKGKVSDKREDDRVMLDPDALQELLGHVRSFGAAHWKELGTEFLDAEGINTISTAPEAARAKAFSARGFMTRIQDRTLNNGEVARLGTLHLDDGSTVYFASHRRDERLIIDDYVRFDGLFLKLYRFETEEGWKEGPLLVGSEILRSFKPYSEQDIAKMGSRLALVEDDTLKNVTGLGGDAFTAQWMLVDEIVSGRADSIDWQNPIPVTGAQLVQDDPVSPDYFDPHTEEFQGKCFLLGKEIMGDMLANGARWRGLPFVLPVSKNMHAESHAAGENPSRLETVTDGWIGNWTWTGRAGFFQYTMPYDKPSLADANKVQYVTGQGYFLKNVYYQPSVGDVRAAPYFVMRDVEEFIPVEDTSISTIMMALVVGGIFLVLLLPYLLMRDRQKSEQLQANLNRRKQERRRRQAQAVAEGSGSGS